MSTLKSIGTKANPKWEVRFVTPEGRFRRRRFSRKADALNFLATTDHQKLTGEFVDPMAGRITFKDYTKNWLERKRATTKTGTADTYASHLRRHLEPEFGTMQLRSITREHVKAFAGRLGEEVAPTTARQVVYTLVAIFREAIDDGRLAVNPAERVAVGAKTDRQADPMRVANVAAKVPAIADAMPPRWRAAVLLMASTGLRLGECLGLTVDRVDFLRRTIRVDRQLTRAAGATFGTPKTKAGVRTIPVPEFVIELLAAHLTEFPAGQDGLIFTTSTGAPVPPSNWSAAYRDACAEAKVEGSKRTHDLRHVAASALIASGTSVAAVQAILGHASASETLDVYTHFWPTDEDKVRAAIEQGAALWRASH